MNKMVSSKSASTYVRRVSELGRSGSHRTSVAPFRIDTDETVADIRQLTKATPGLQAALGFTVHPGKFEVSMAGYEPDTGYQAVSFRTRVRVRGRIFGPGSVHLFDNMGWCGAMGKDEFARCCRRQKRASRPRSGSLQAAAYC